MIQNAIKILALVLIVCSFTSCGYNQMVSYDEGVAEKWGNVQSAYQRRADLVPNIQSIIEGSAQFEKSTLTDITNARSKATGITIDPSNITPEQLKKFESAQSNLSGAFSRLLATFERYPDLKTTQAFRDFQRQYEGTENRIKVARDEFNGAARSYNTYVRSFPRVLYAGMLGFSRKAYFEAQSGSDQAPTIKFNTGKN